MNGVKIDIEMEANDSYDRTANGAALKMVAIQSKIDSGDLVGITVASSAGVVTVTNTTSTVGATTIVDVSGGGLIADASSGLISSIREQLTAAHQQLVLLQTVTLRR